MAQTLSKLSVLLLLNCSLGADEPAVQSLAGQWRFELDPSGQGIAARWYNRKLADSVRLPGTTDTNGKGTKNEARPPSRLSRKWTYAGAAWYQRDIEIPPSWAGSRVTLLLERTRVTRVWLDDREIEAMSVRLSVPHTYHLGAAATPGSHRLTIVVDNAYRLPAGGHLVSDDTQTNWNGILGRIELAATPLVWIGDVRVSPDIKRRVAAVRVRIGNASGKTFEGTLALRAESFNSPKRHTASKSVPVHVAGANQAVDVELPMGPGTLAWDEFHPALYRLTATFGGDRATVEFGMRRFTAAGTQFAINGKKSMLRGRHDSGVFPLTGFPPMDLEAWTRYFRILKTYGLNHVRFHSWCPPETAFEAADREGFYLQPELPLWGQIPDARVPGRVPYLLEEGTAILDRFGNHPSFVMFSLGNELSGDRAVMGDMISRFRRHDGRHLYASGTNAFFDQPRQQPGDDYWITMRTRVGEKGRTRASYSHVDLPLGHVELGPPGTQNDYRAALEGVTIPVVGHEVGQYQVFPDFDEIPKYTGVLEARNFGEFRDRLEKAGMLDQWKDFFRASGALSVLCYREEIEAALRTPGFGGFELLDVQDYPGQGTALVGILDAFMDSKGLIAPERWREFCNATVPLLRFDKYTWTTAEEFGAEAWLSNYGESGLPHALLEWQLTGSRGEVLRSGSLPPAQVAQGSQAKLGGFSIPLRGLPAPARYELALTLQGSAIRNHYPLWVYPAAVDTAAPAGVTVARAFDADTRQKLEAGGTVVLFPSLTRESTSSKVLFMTDFWCYPMFKSASDAHKMEPSPGTMGILLDPRHPALSEFPTAFHTDWQWWWLVKSSRAMILDGTPAAYRPIVQVIDNMYRNHKFGLVLETRAGRGKLLICGIDLPSLQDRPEGRQLMRSLLRYAGGPQFDPPVALDPALLAKLLL